MDVSRLQQHSLVGESRWSRFSSPLLGPAETWQENHRTRGQYYLYSPVGQGVQPDSGLAHTFKHTAAHGRICACACACAAAFLPMSCRGGSAHVHCWLSNLSNQCYSNLSVKTQNPFAFACVHACTYCISRDNLLVGI